MNILILAGGSWLAGLLAFFGLPVVVSAVSRKHGTRLGHHWIDMALRMLGRALLIKRENGGFALRGSTYDSRRGVEKATIGGEPKTWKDPHGFMSRLKKRPFGLVHEKRNTVINPRVAEVGERVEERRARGEDVVEKGGRRWYNGYLSLPTGDGHLVDLDRALAVIPTQGAPGDVDDTEVLVEKSQTMYDTKKIAQWVAWLVAFGAGFGVFYLAYEVAGKEVASGGGSPVQVGMWIAPTLGVLPL